MKKNITFPASLWRSPVAPRRASHLAADRAAIPSAPPAGEPDAFTGLQAAQLRALAGTPAFTRKDGAVEMWRYDTASCRAFFFFTGAPPRCSMSETVPRGTNSAADPACLSALRSRKTLSLGFFRRKLFGLVRENGTDRAPRRSGRKAFAPCRYSGHAGSASDGHAAGISPAPAFPGPVPLPAHSFPAPVRCGWETRKICVSTAMVGSPNATFRTTLAVLRPTPCNSSSASRSWGTWPPCFSIRILDKRDHILRLAAIKPDGLDRVGRVSPRPAPPSFPACPRS